MTWTRSRRLTDRSSQTVRSELPPFARVRAKAEWLPVRAARPNSSRRVKLLLNLVWLSFGGRSLALGYAVVALVM
jgi:hypothetical protein